MKDTRYSIAMRTLLIILAVTFMPVLSSIAQAKATTYQNTYKPAYHQSVYSMPAITSSPTAPSVVFNSTSTYSMQEVEQQSILNEDGTINERNYVRGSRPRRIGSPDDDDEPDEGEGGGSNNSGQGGDNNWNGSDVPLGDTLIPLFLLALAYAIYKVSRRRKEA